MPNAAPAIDAPRLSIVVPVLNEAGRLPGQLQRLRQGFPDAELLVVDGGSSDGTAAEALRAGATLLLGTAGRAAQMNLGAASARGAWLWFLHADTRPRFDAAGLHPCLKDDPGRSTGPGEGDPSWGFCRIELEGHSGALRLIAGFMNRRSRLTGVATGDQGLLVRRSTFEAVGGFACIPLMEDVEICKRLRRRARPNCLPLIVISSGRRWEEQGVIRTVLRMWALRLAFWLGVAPDRLWRHYYGRAALASQAGTAASGRD